MGLSQTVIEPGAGMDSAIMVFRIQVAFEPALFHQEPVWNVFWPV